LLLFLTVFFSLPTPNQQQLITCNALAAVRSHKGAGPRSTEGCSCSSRQREKIKTRVEERQCVHGTQFFPNSAIFEKRETDLSYLLRHLFILNMLAHDGAGWCGAIAFPSSLCHEQGRIRNLSRGDIFHISTISANQSVTKTEPALPASMYHTR
jgi:hypothetical protein